MIIMSLYKNIYNDFIQSRKDKRENDKAVLSLLYNNLKNKTIELRSEDLTDADTYNIIKKLVKQLEEEIEMNIKVNRTEKVNELTYQKDLIQKYLPKMLSEAEIKDIINSLEDKSIPNIMKHFKMNYNGLVDMGLVNKLARN